MGSVFWLLLGFTLGICFRYYKPWLHRMLKSVIREVVQEELKQNKAESESQTDK